MNKKPRIRGPIFKGRIQIQGNSAIFKFPKDILKDLDYEKKIFAVLVDGVIQITDKYPNSVIPVASFSIKDFIAH